MDKTSKLDNMFDDEYIIARNIFIITLLALVIIGLISLFHEPKEYKGYLILKYTNLEQIHAKHIQPNIYGIKFHLVYQEDKTSIRYEMDVSKEKYESLIPRTDSLITFYIE